MGKRVFTEEKNKQKKGVPKPPPFPIISKKKPTKKTFVIPVEKKIKRESIIPDTIIEEQGKQNNEESNELRNNNIDSKDRASVIEFTKNFLIENVINELNKINDMVYLEEKEIEI